MKYANALLIRIFSISYEKYHANSSRTRSSITKIRPELDVRRRRRRRRIALHFDDKWAEIRRSDHGRPQSEMQNS